MGHGVVEIDQADGPIGGAPIMIRSGERWPKNASDEPTENELAILGAADLQGVTRAEFAAPQPVTPAPIVKPCVGANEETVRCDLDLAEHADPIRAEAALYAKPAGSSCAICMRHIARCKRGEQARAISCGNVCATK